MWLLEIKLVSVVLAAAGGIDSVSSQCCNYRRCWYQWFMLLPEAIWMPMTCAHIEGQIDVQSPFFPWGPGWSSCDHLCVCGLCCHLRTCWWLWSWMLGGQCCCLWSALPLEAVFRSMVHAAPREHVEVHRYHAAPRDHGDVCGPFCHRTLCGISWFYDQCVLSLAVTSREASFSALTVSGRMRVRGIFSFL